MASSIGSVVIAIALAARVVCVCVCVLMRVLQCCVLGVSVVCVVCVVAAGSG